MKRLRMILGGLLVCVLTGVSGVYAADKCTVFLLGGQSNMDGKGMVSELPASYTNSPGNVKIWRNDTWEPMTPSGDWFGPEIGFAHAISDMLPDEDIRLIKYGVSGTSLYEDWAPVNGPQYVGFMATAEAALQNLDTGNIDYEIAGMLWLQGESDALENQANNYYANLTAFIARMRSEFKTSAMPFIIARVLDFYGGETGQAEIVRNTQVRIGSSDKHAAWFFTDDCDLHDPGHYNASGQLVVGHRFATNYLEVASELVTFDNGGFEADLLDAGGFYSGAPTGWTNNGTGTVGTIGETRTGVTDTPDGSGWAQLQATGAMLGQAIGGASLVDTEIEVAYIVSRQAGEGTATDHHVKIMAGSASTFTGGVVLASGQYNTPLTAEGAYNSVSITLIPTGDLQGNDTLWLVFENATGGALHIDAVSADTGGNKAPVFYHEPIKELDAVSILEGTTYSNTLAGTVFDPENDPMTFSRASGPVWLNVSSNGTLIGTPSHSDLGMHAFTIAVSDGNGGTNSVTLDISVLEALDTPAILQSAEQPVVGPAEIADCVLWLDAGQGVSTNGTAVSAWADQSGASNHVAQATTAYQPEYVASRSTLNNLPTLAFDSTGGDYLGPVDLGVASTDDRTVFVVMIPDAGYQNNELLGLDTQHQFDLGTWSRNNRLRVRGDADTYSADGSVAYGSPHLLAVESSVSGTYLRAWNDGDTILNESSTAFRWAMNAFNIGTAGTGNDFGRSFKGEVAEVLVFSRALSDLEHSQIGNYLADKYALTTSYETPAAVTDCVLWLDAGQGVTESSQLVSDWADQSGWGHHVVQTVSGYRPVYTLSQSALNHRPALTFGADGGDYLGPVDLGVASTDDRTVFVVAVPEAGHNNNELLGLDTQYQFDLGTWSRNNRLRVRDGAVNTYSADGSVAYGSAHILAVEGSASGTYLRAWNDGTVILDQASTAFQWALNPFNIGTDDNIGRSFKGAIAEVIIFNRTLSDEEHEELGSYLSRKYGISGTYSVPPASPSGLSAASGDASVSLDWADNSESNLTGYTVYRSLDTGSYGSALASGVSASEYADTTVTNGTRYYYVVTAVSAGGESSQSGEVSAVPSVAISSNEYHIAGHTLSGTNLSLAVSNSVPGHAYWILASDSLTPPLWSNILVEAGTGTNLQFDLPVSGTNRYFKLDVQRQ